MFIEFEQQLHNTKEEQTRNLSESGKLKILEQVNVKRAVIRELEFLREVNRHPCLFEDNVIQRAIYR